MNRAAANKNIFSRNNKLLNNNTYNNKLVVKKITIFHIKHASFLANENTDKNLKNFI